MKKEIFTINTKDLTEIAILCALAIVLDRFIKIPIAVSGGSLNISMAPLYIIALRHGPFKSFLAGGIVFGLITCLFDGYGLVCYPLEYFISFGAVAILGLFGNRINQLLSADNAKSYVVIYILLTFSIGVAATIRFLCASIDSVILWDYTFTAAFAYNLTYVYPSALTVLLVVCLLLPTIKLLNRSFKTTYLN